MKSKTWKKTVTILLVISMLASAVGINRNTAEASETSEDTTETVTVTLDDLGSDYTVVTPKYFGITKESSYESNTSFDKTGGWNKKVFHGKVKFSKDTGHKIYFGAANWNGLYIHGTTDGNLYYNTFPEAKNDVAANSGTIYAAQAGKTSLVNEWLDFAVSIEVVDATTKQMRVGFFIDEVLYRNEYVTISEVDSALFTGNCHLFLSASASDTVHIAPLPTIALNDLGSDYTVVTPEYFGITAESSYTQNTHLVKSGGWNKKVFHGKVKFSKDTRRKLFLGTNIWAGLYIEGHSDGSLYYNVSPIKEGLEAEARGGTIYADQVGKTSLTEVWLDFAVSIEVVDTITIKVGFFIDEELYQNKYVTLKGLAKDHFTGNCSLYLTAEENGQTVEIAPLPEEAVENNHFLEITQADFDFDGVRGEEKRSDITGTVGTLRSEFIKGLNGTKLNVDVLFPTSSAAKLCYGVTKSTDDGLMLYSDGEGNLVLHTNTSENDITIFAETAGSTLVGERINLQISYAHAATGGALLGIWINGQLYDDDYISLPTVERLGTGLATVGTDTAAVTIRMPLESMKPNEAFEQITFSDFNVKDNDKPSVYSVYDGSVLNKVFSGKVRFWAGNFFSYAGVKTNTQGWNGFRIKVLSEDSLEFEYIDDEVASLIKTTIHSATAGTKFTGRDILLSYSIEAVDLDKDGVQDDVKFGMFFNGQLYNNRYFYVSASGKNLAQDIIQSSLGIHSSGAGVENIRYYSVEDWRWELGLKTALSDYGIEDGAYVETEEGSLHIGTNQVTMDKKLFEADVKLEDGGGILFGGSQANDSLKLYRDEEWLYLESVNEKLTKTMISYENAWVSLEDEFNLKIYLEAVEHGINAEKDAAYVSIWLDDVFVGSFYADEFNVGDYVAVNNATVSSAKRSIPDDYDYEEYTFGDFGDYGLNYQEYSQDTESVIAGMAQDEVIITDKLTIKGEALVTISGYTFRTANGKMTVSRDNVALAEAEVGESSFSFALVQNLTDADGDGSRDDICLGIYVNDVLCGNRQYYLTDVTLGNACVIDVNGGTVITEAKKPVAWPVDIDEISNGYTLADDVTTVGVNGQQAESGAQLTKVGDYYIVYNTDSGKEKQAVAVYKTGDVNADGVADIKDLVALKKAQAGKKVLTEAGKAAADIDADGSYGTDDAILREGMVTSMNEVKEKYREFVFGIISDMHYRDGLNGQREKNFRKALELYREQGAKVIIMNGDVSDYGTTQSYARLLETIQEVFPDLEQGPKFIVTSDGHEYYDSWPWLFGSNAKSYTETQQRVLDNFATKLNQTTLNTHTVVDEYHIIGISCDSCDNYGVASYSDETVTYLENALKEAKESGDNNRPIFVAIHQPPQGTVAGTESATIQLRALLAQYPQAVVFTSHTHASVKRADNIYQEYDAATQQGFTIVNTASLYYVGVAGEAKNRDPQVSSVVENAYDFGEGLLARTKGNSVTIERYNFFADEKIQGDWIVTTSANGSTLTDYTAGRAELRTAPVFAEGTTLNVKQTGDTSVRLSFHAASHEDFVHYYEIEVLDENENVMPQTGKYVTAYHMGALPEIQEFNMEGLTAGTKYTFRVYAAETYGKKSAAITQEFTLESHQN